MEEGTPIDQIKYFKIIVGTDTFIDIRESLEKKDYNHSAILG